MLQSKFKKYFSPKQDSLKIKRLYKYRMNQVMLLKETFLTIQVQPFLYYVSFRLVV